MKNNKKTTKMRLFLLELDRLSAVDSQSKRSFVTGFESCGNDQITTLIQLRALTHLMNRFSLIIFKKKRKSIDTKKTNENFNLPVDYLCTGS